MSSFASYNNHHNSFKKEAIFSIFNSINWETFLWQHICTSPSLSENLGYHHIRMSFWASVDFSDNPI